MNQQRQRRFRSAETMAQEHQGEVLAPGQKAPFDSNCITPGTPFMARLSEVIKFYIQKKIKDDQSWRGTSENRYFEHLLAFFLYFS